MTDTAAERRDREERRRIREHVIAARKAIAESRQTNVLKEKP